MASEARISFYGNLNDFLSLSARGRVQSYQFNGKPSLKDAIEAIGIPHVEIFEIKVNGIPSRLDDFVFDRAQIEVFPVTTPIIHRNYHFVADSHLGKLAKALRILGFDTIYRQSAAERALIEAASKEERILLTRSVNLLKHRVLERGYWIRSENPKQQLREVALRFDLKRVARPFSRCSVCNGVLVAVDKVRIMVVLPPLTRQHFDEFFQCQSCKNVYWKGSHYERMLKTIHDLEE